MLSGMSVPLTLLGLLEREPSHGYELKRDYDMFFGRGKPLSYGQVYGTLSRLARDGKAIAGPAEHGEGPERRRYVITEQGVVNLLLCRSLAEREGALRAIAGDTDFGKAQSPDMTSKLRARGIVMRPSDLGIDVRDAKRELLAAQTIDDLVTCSGGLYAPPAKFLNHRRVK